MIVSYNHIDAPIIVNVYEGKWHQLLPGIRARAGIKGLPPGMYVDDYMGADLIDMEPGTQFPLHTHKGGHILFILKGEGTVTVGEQVYKTHPGDCYFIAGDLPHGVGAIKHHQVLAIGFPHTAVDNPSRMEIMDAEYINNYPQIAQIYSGNDHEERRRRLASYQADNSAAEMVPAEDEIIHD